MKNFRNIFLILLTVVFIDVAFAGSTFVSYVGIPEAHSLRAQALGGYTLDDLDRSFDPIELRFVDGFRLFTNLGNYNGGDQVLSGSGNSEYLVGFAMQNPILDKLSNALLIKYTNTDNSIAVINNEINGAGTSVGAGELLSEFTSWIDIDNDGIYDIKNSTSAKSTGFNYYDTQIITFNNSFALNKFIVGGKLSYVDKKAEGTVATGINVSGGSTRLLGYNTGDASFNYVHKNYDLAEDYLVTRQAEDGDFSDINQITNIEFVGSFLMPDFKGYELRGDLGIYNKSNHEDTEDFYSGSLESYHMEGIEYYIDLDKTNGRFNSQEETSGNTIGFHASVRKTFNKGAIRAEDDFWEVGALFDMGFYDYFNNQLTEISAETKFSTTGLNFAGDDSVTSWRVDSFDSDLDVSDDGDLNNINYGFISKYEQTLHEKVRFVAASSIIFSKKTWETKQIFDYREATETLIGEIYLDPNGNYFDEANDTRYLKTATYNADRTREEFVTTFEAVSGIEFKFTENNKWLMRIGSIFTVVKTVSDDKIQITEHSATVEENWTGANTYSTTNSNNEYVSSSAHTITTTSATLFRYGLGYRPNENLSIDILGVFDGSGNVPTNGSENEDLLDLAFIKSLKLGFSLRW